MEIYRKHYPIRFWGGVVSLVLAVGLGALLIGQVLGVVPEVNEFIVDESKIDTPFELAWQVLNLNRNAARAELVSHFVGRKFITSGTVVRVGTLGSGNMWAAMRGDTGRGDFAEFECHFVPQYENALRGYASSGLTANFSGSVAGYTKGWLIMSGCEIQ